MARMLFGIIGDSWGHISQVLALIDSMPAHEYLFVGSGRVPQLADLGYRVAAIPAFGTYYRGNRVDIPATAWKGLLTILGMKRIVANVVEIMKDFKPDLVFTSYEYSVPVAAHKLGLQVISLDNSHFLTKCKCDLPKGQTLSRWGYGLTLRHLYSNADYFFINAFYGLEPLDPSNTSVFPPLLRKPVLEITPTEGDHVVVYHTSPTFQAVERFLEKMPGKFLIYGLGEKPSRGNLEYKVHSVQGFLQDLASCRYVISNGGHTVMAEALYFGKPVLSFPISFAYEQYFNGHMLRTLGYGDYCLSPTPDMSLLTRFEERLDEFRTNMAGRDFCGNQQVAAKVRAFL